MAASRPYRLIAVLASPGEFSLGHGFGIVEIEMASRLLPVYPAIRVFRRECNRPGAWRRGDYI